MTQTPDDPGPSLEARLSAARARQAAPERPPGSRDPSPWGMGVRVGVEMLSALMVAVAIGWGLDRWLHTRPVFLAVFMLLGGAAGVLNVWRMVRPQARDRAKR
jgi:ATP synthase protein I